MSTANRVIKNTAWLYAKMAITMFVSLYTTRLILNGLGASDFGIFNIVGGSIAMLGFLNTAMASATQRFMSYAEGEGKREKQRSIFNVSIVLHTAVAVVMAAVLSVAGYFFFHGILNIPADRLDAAKVVYASLVISTLFTIMNVPYDAVLNAHENMKYYAIVGLIESFLKLSVAFACLYTHHDKLIVYGILMATIPFITLTIMKVYCHRKYEECVLNPRKYWDKGIMSQMASFGGWNLAGTMGTMVGNYGNGVVLNCFFGTVLNAALGIAGQLNGMLYVFSNNMLKALNPVIVKKEGEGERSRMLEYSYTGCKFSFLLFALFCLPCFVEAPYVLKLWLKGYPEWTVLFVRYQIVRTLFEQLTITLDTSLAATGKIKEVSIATFVLDLLPLIVLPLVFHSGASPAWYYPVVIFLMNICTTAVRLFYCRKYCGLHLFHFIRKIMLPCILFCIALLTVGASFALFMDAGIQRLSLCVVLMELLFLPASWILLNSREREILFRIRYNIMNKIKAR